MKYPVTSTIRFIERLVREVPETRGLTTRLI